MKNIAESNLSVFESKTPDQLSFEEQTSDELSFEELESVAGGCNDDGKGKDSIAREAGHLAGDIVAAPVKAVSDFASGFWKGLWD